MALESGINERLVFIAEVTQGVTPATPAMAQLLFDGRELGEQRAQLVSPSVINDGMAGNMRQGFRTQQGTTPFTLRYENFDDLFELHLGGTWTAGVSPAAQGDLVVATTSTITSAGATFITDGYEVGDLVDLANFTEAGNNIRTTILGVAAGTLTFPAVLTVEGADVDATITVVGEKLKVGTTLRTWSMERQWTGITQYLAFLGMSTSAMSLNVGTGANVTGDATWVGMTSADKSGTSIADSVPAVTERDPIASLDAASRLYLATNQIVDATGITLSMARPRAGTEVVFSTSSPGIFDADLEVSGTVARLLDSNEAEYTKYFNETPFVLHELMFDKDGTNFVKVTIPAAVYTGGTFGSVQGAGPIPQNMPWRANKDTVTGANIIMQKSNT